MYVCKKENITRENENTATQNWYLLVLDKELLRLPNDFWHTL